MEFVFRFFRGWGVLLGVPALFAFSYLYHNIPLLPRIRICAVRGFLGCDCPGCGLTRSFQALVHGDLKGSIDFHPLGVVIALWMTYFFFRVLIEVVSGRKLPALLSRESRDIVLYVFLGALILQWVFKLLLGAS